LFLWNNRIIRCGIHIHLVIEKLMQTKNMKKQNNPDMIFETPFLSKEKTH